jgi:hypothetical protein
MAVAMRSRRERVSGVSHWRSALGFPPELAAPSVLGLGAASSREGKPDSLPLWRLPEVVGSAFDVAEVSGRSGPSVIAPHPTSTLRLVGLLKRRRKAPADVVDGPQLDGCELIFAVSP